ncbi:type II secretion system F family protein [Thermodesulfobacterium sp.]|jgi:type IV pilus assembly protein PilC|uniref:type II secretion system F family protein n=1 Tax=Thermodesulfobacterium sp. TaxID=1965289 RepID=UPI00257A1086|nr:type II secretion system F family protein [Thermodesulfobacterium sp.]MBZ4681634.1 pilus assembly protein PilC [Thermodesulfobacterium sp.]MDN5379604.1 type pilus assembly protein PilC [Thermodesulfobacterium sp.]
MPLYEWEGRSVTGEIRKGVLEAANPQLVEVYLRRLNLTPIKITEKKQTSLRFFKLKSVSDKELAGFTRQFAVVLEAGLPIVKCLEILAEQQRNRYFKEVIRDIKYKVETGVALSEAMAHYPKIFNNLYIQMIRSGESSGNLDMILHRLADYIEKVVGIKSKVKHAMIYPSVVVAVTIIVISVIMLFVIPKFAEIYESAGQALPWPTQIVINISKNFGKILIFLILLGIGLSLGIKVYRRSEQGRYVTDKFLLKLPLLGELFLKAAVARTARTLANLVGGGVQLLPALTIAGETSGNKIIEKAMEEVRINVSAGQSIADPMMATGVFPFFMVEMVRVGEMSGKLEEMLNKVAGFFEEEVDRMVNTLSTLIEPILIVILGVIVGGILVALYLPIFKLGEVIGGMR